MDQATATTPQPSQRITAHSWWHPARTSFFWMVLIALTLRLGVIFVTHTYKFKTVDDNFSFGYEMGRIGRSLASGQGFANPFNETTGPTAWEPPLYPFLIAGRCFNENVAVWASWFWALLPSGFATRWVWETSLAALLLAIIFWLTLELKERDGLRPWLEFGLLWGIPALTNPSMLAFLPASGLWAWYRRAKSGKRSVGGIAVASIIFFACIAPWLIRNYRTFGQVVFLRSNFGAELRIGNGPGANGTWREYLHPTQNVYEMRRYRELGEIAYVAQRKREAIAFIREDYLRFAGLCTKRFIYYWAGRPRPAQISALPPIENLVFLASSVLALWGLARALRKRRPGAWLFFWLILCYPLVYYVTFPHARYRHPIEPELTILIVYVISEAERKENRLKEIPA